MARRWLTILLCTSLSWCIWAGKKKEKEVNQTLEAPPEPPAVVTADPRQLGFYAAPLTTKGLLSPQTRDALHSLFKQTKGATILRLRAFVAGTGDLRRVQAIASEEFTARHLPIPVLTVVQVGALPAEGAQVQIEAITSERKPVNPSGVAFISGQQVTDPDPFKPPLPLLQQSLQNLQTAAQAAEADVIQVSCFTHSLEGLSALQGILSATFPQAAVTLQQMQRGPSMAVAECQGTGRVRSPGDTPVVFLNPPGLRPSPNYSQVAVVRASQIALSSAQLGFQNTDQDVTLAFERLDKSLQTAGTGLRRAVAMNTYPVGVSVVERIRRLRFGFLNPQQPPSSLLLTFEGLPSLDAPFAMDVVAVTRP